MYKRTILVCFLISSLTINTSAQQWSNAGSGNNYPTEVQDVKSSWVRLGDGKFKEKDGFDKSSKLWARFVSEGNQIYVDLQWEFQRRDATPIEEGSDLVFRTKSGQTTTLNAISTQSAKITDGYSKQIDSWTVTNRYAGDLSLFLAEDPVTTFYVTKSDGQYGFSVKKNVASDLTDNYSYVLRNSKVASTRSTANSDRYVSSSAYQQSGNSSNYISKSIDSSTNNLQGKSGGESKTYSKASTKMGGTMDWYSQPATVEPVAAQEWSTPSGSSSIDGFWGLKFGERAPEVQKAVVAKAVKGEAKVKEQYTSYVRSSMSLTEVVLSGVKFNSADLLFVDNKLSAGTFVSTFNSTSDAVLLYQKLKGILVNKYGQEAAAGKAQNAVSWHDSDNQSTVTLSMDGYSGRGSIVRLKYSDPNADRAEGGKTIFYPKVEDVTRQYEPDYSDF